MKPINKLMITSVAIATLAATGAAAHGGKGGKGHGRGINVERLADQLDLSTEQLAEVRQLVDDARPSLRASRDELRTGREQLRDQIRAVLSLEQQTQLDELRERRRDHRRR